MSGVTQTVGWTDLSRNGTIFDAAGNIEVNEVAPRTANYGQVTSRPDPALARGNNWEYSAVIQHELMPRLSVTAGYYRRDFYNLQINDNLNVGTERLVGALQHQHSVGSEASPGGAADPAGTA